MNNGKMALRTEFYLLWGVGELHLQLTTTGFRENAWSGGCSLGVKTHWGGKEEERWGFRILVETLFGFLLIDQSDFKAFLNSDRYLRCVSLCSAVSGSWPEERGPVRAAGDAEQSRTGSTAQTQHSTMWLLVALCMESQTLGHCWTSTITEIL